MDWPPVPMTSMVSDTAIIVRTLDAVALLLFPPNRTPEQIQQQKEQAEQADLSEDTQYEDDQGDKAYQQGNWGDAGPTF